MTTATLDAALGNLIASDGLDTCYCGSTHWDDDLCVTCGTPIIVPLADPNWDGVA